MAGTRVAGRDESSGHSARGVTTLLLRAERIAERGGDKLVNFVHRDLLWSPFHPRQGNGSGATRSIRRYSRT
jgi:hypothetical protein